MGLIIYILNRFDSRQDILRENETLSTENPSTFTVVKPGELYYFNAIAIRKNTSSEKSIKGYRTPPIPVSGLSVSDVTNSSFLLNWTLPNLEQTEFDKIEIFEAGQKIATLSDNSNSFLFENYEPSHLALLHVFTATVKN